MGRQRTLAAFAASLMVASPMAISVAYGEDTNLDEISIYATKNDIPAFTVPGSVTVINRDAINDRSPRSMNDIYKSIPGLRDGGGARRTGQIPVLRGISGAGVLVLFDGVRQNFNSGHSGRFFISPDLLKAVEVVRGPGSALYGSSAIGGVIALTTIDASDLLSPGEVAAIRTAFGYQGVDNELKAAVTGAFQIERYGFEGIISMSYKNAGNIKLGNGTTLPADDEILSGLVKGKFRLTEATTITASWIHRNGDKLEPRNPQGNNVANPRNLNSNRDVKHDTVRGTLEYKPVGNQYVDFRGTVYGVRNDVNETDPTTARTTTRNLQTFGVNLDNRSWFQFNDYAKVTFTYGGEFYQDKQTAIDTTGAGGVRGGVPNAKTRFFGAFTQALIELGDLNKMPGKLTIIPGVRYDNFKTGATSTAPGYKDSAVSLKIGVTYQPVKWLMLFGKYAHGFRAPTFNETSPSGTHFNIGPFFPGDAFRRNAFIPNPNLRPEKAQTFEFGAGLTFNDVLRDGDRAQIKGSFWQSDVKNFINLQVNAAGCFAFPFNQATCTSQSVNTPKARLKGVEIEGTYDSERFFTRATFEWITGKDRQTGAFTGNLSPIKFFVDAGIKIPEFDARIGGRATVAGRFTKVNNPASVRPSYEVFDIYAVWQPSDGPLMGFRVDLGIDNIADKAYQKVGAGSIEPGRNFKAAITYTKKL